jgi:hypothetical protein
MRLLLPIGRKRKTKAMSAQTVCTIGQIVETRVIILENVKRSAGVTRYLQISADICRYLQISADIWQISAQKHNIPC